jgi:hypothetical protein
VQPAREQEILTAETRLAHPRFQNRSGLFSDLKLHWVLSFLLHHDGP